MIEIILIQVETISYFFSRALGVFHSSNRESNNSDNDEHEMPPVLQPAQAAKTGNTKYINMYSYVNNTNEFLYFHRIHLRLTFAGNFVGFVSKLNDFKTNV